MSDNTPTTFVDDPGRLAAVIILGVVIILLFGVAVVGFCVFLRKRELLCFKTRRSSTRKNYSDTEYSYLYEKQAERVTPRRRFLNRAPEKRQGSQAKQRADQKALLRNPLDIDLENEPGNWENPFIFARRMLYSNTKLEWKLPRTYALSWQSAIQISLPNLAFENSSSSSIAVRHGLPRQIQIARI